jgi:hypothetical protein
MKLKSVVKKLLPARITREIGSMLVERREKQLGQLSLRDAFDEVYKQRMWKQGDADSGVGSEGLPAERYISLVKEYAASHRLRTVVDGGCGDFRVGSQLAPNFERYTALDVSPHIVALNNQRYADLVRKNVTFATADMTAATFPHADLVLIRQVLQHLTNAQIGKILANLFASDWRRVLITESVHAPDDNPSPNLDLPTHTVRTRTSLGSGVFLDKPPFSLPARRIATIYSTANGRVERGGLLVMELSRDRD